MDQEIIIRPAKVEDAERLAVLAGQMGSEVNTEEASERIKTISQDNHWVILAAQTSDGKIVGWAQVSATQLLLKPLQAELRGLVVDSNFRGGGVGRKLMQTAEEWAKNQGCTKMRVDSNVERSEAHGFYEKIGYEKYKEQAIFRKKL